MKTAVIGRDYTAGFLPAMLERVKPQVCERTGITGTVDAENTAFIFNGSIRFQSKIPLPVSR